jgi:hypothetical protein
MEKIKAVVIGLGRIASLLEDDTLREKPCTHAGAIAANSECILAAGCDIDEERRRLFSERWGCPVYSSAAVMLAEIKPDIVHIATHPDSHYFYCRLAAEMGVPLAICEKPLADTLAEAKKIAALHSKGTIKIITNHERRYSADYIRAKEILAEGALGLLLSVNARLYMGKTQRLLDVLWHDGTHLADAAVFLSGARLRHRRSWGAKLNAREGTAWIEGLLKKKQETWHPVRQDTCAKSIPFIMELGAGRDHLVFELEFSCVQGRLRIGNGIFEVWESVPSPYAEKFRSLKRTGEIFKGPTGYFSNMVNDALVCCRDPSGQPQSSASDGLAVIEYLNSIKSWRGLLL